MCAARGASAEDAVPEAKDRYVAFALSAGGTGLSIGLVALGGKTGNNTLATAGLLSSLVTPAAGEIYADKLVTWGMGIRLVSAGVLVVGYAEAFRCLFASEPCSTDPSAAGTMIAVGALGYATGVVYDIAAAGSVVDDYNRRLRLRVTPTVIPTASSSPAVGLGIGGSF
ncbi:MAG TPA: hypothetical protein VF516_34290 [Kofleriaceae bacterium]